MMHMRRARRPHLRHLHPLIFRKVRGHNLVRVFHFAPRRNLHRLRHLHHLIRRQNIPSFTPHPWRRRIARIPSRRSSVRPRRNRRHLFLSQRRIVRKMSESWIGEPGWHHLHLDRRRHFPRPWPCLLVSHQRKRRSFSTAVATLAFILQNRDDIFIEGR